MSVFPAWSKFNRRIFFAELGMIEDAESETAWRGSRIEQEDLDAIEEAKLRVHRAAKAAEAASLDDKLPFGIAHAEAARTAKLAAIAAGKVAKVANKSRYGAIESADMARAAAAREHKLPEDEPDNVPAPIIGPTKPLSKAPQPDLDDDLDDEKGKLQTSNITPPTKLAHLDTSEEIGRSLNSTHTYKTVGVVDNLQKWNDTVGKILDDASSDKSRLDYPEFGKLVGILNNFDLTETGDVYRTGCDVRKMTPTAAILGKGNISLNGLSQGILKIRAPGLPVFVRSLVNEDEKFIVDRRGNYKDISKVVDNSKPARVNESNYEIMSETFRDNRADYIKTHNPDSKAVADTANKALRMVSETAIADARAGRLKRDDEHDGVDEDTRTRAADLLALIFMNGQFLQKKNVAAFRTLLKSPNNDEFKTYFHDLYVLYGTILKFCNCYPDRGNKKKVLDLFKSDIDKNYTETLLRLTGQPGNKR